MWLGEGGGEEDILGLEVSVEDVDGVQVLEAAADVDRQALDQGYRETMLVHVDGLEVSKTTEVTTCKTQTRDRSSKRN